MKLLDNKLEVWKEESCLQSYESIHYLDPNRGKNNDNYQVAKPSDTISG